MLTGSFASSMQGEPRLSHDIDIVVDFPAKSLPELLKRFPPPEFYLDEQSVREAISARTMFSLLQASEGDKVDFWLLTDDPFDVARFARRRSELALGLKLFVSSPEDTILMKLRWSELSGGSEKHLYDALRVYEVQFGTLDMNYIAKWLEALGLQDLWTQLLRKSTPG
jgi:hypothetical protein